MEIRLNEENGLVLPLWSLDDSYITDKDEDTWYFGELAVEFPNDNVNYTVSYDISFFCNAVDGRLV